MPTNYPSILLALVISTTALSCSNDIPTENANSARPRPGHGAKTFTVQLSHVGNRSAGTVTTSSSEFHAMMNVGSEAAMNRDELRSRLMRFREKGPLTLILVEDALRDNVIAEVHLNSPGSISRFMIIRRSTLNDEIIDRAHALARNYSMRNPGNLDEVILRLAPDASFVQVSKEGELRGVQKLEAFYSSPKKNRRSRWLLESAARLPISDIPGIGRGRIMTLGDRK